MNSLYYSLLFYIETGSCVYPPEYSDADWYRKDIKYAVDKSLEFSEVLFTSTGDVNIYGNGERLYTKNGMNKTTYINGLNKSVYETVDMKFDFYGCRETSKEYSYTDTGYSKEHKFGYGYNGEALDDTGLIYLRARYYNPRIGQFIQLDTYKGEQDSIESQNRYAYTMNNPYKYVDRGGNTTFHEMTYGTKPKPASTKTTKKNTTVYPPHSYQGWSDLNSKKPKKPSKPKPPKGNSNGDKGKTNDRPSKTEDEFKEELEAMKALIAPDPEPCPDIDLRETKWNTFFGTYQKVNKMKFNVEVYKHENIKSQKVPIAAKIGNNNYQALWISRESFGAAYSIIDFILAIKTLGKKQVTEQSVKTILKKYGKEIGKTSFNTTLIEFVNMLNDSDIGEADLAYRFIKGIFGCGDLFIFLEKIDRIRAFTNHSGIKKILGSTEISKISVRPFDPNIEDGFTFADLRDTDYTYVATYNYISCDNFASNVAAKYAYNPNNIEFYKTYDYDANEKLFKDYLVYA